MAKTKIESTKINDFNDYVILNEFVSVATPADGALIPFNDADHKTVVIIKNSNAASQTVTFKAGNGIQGAQDMNLTIPTGKTILVSLESGKFKNVSGEDAGYVLMTASSADIGVQVAVLP